MQLTKKIIRPIAGKSSAIDLNIFMIFIALGSGRNKIINQKTRNGPMWLHIKFKIFFTTEDTVDNEECQNTNWEHKELSLTAGKE